MYELIVFLAIFIELGKAEAEKVLMSKTQERMESMCKRLEKESLTIVVFKQIVMRLKDFGIISIQQERNKVGDNVYLQSFFFYDEIKSALTGHKIYEKFKDVFEANEN